MRNFDEAPFLVIWELTQACDLACVHCRACAIENRNPLELSTPEGYVQVPYGTHTFRRQYVLACFLNGRFYWCAVAGA
jgi:MoaA/NifB/PqqE/SkfB family radical SAM enzyme